MGRNVLRWAAVVLIWSAWGLATSVVVGLAARSAQPGSPVDWVKTQLEEVWVKTGPDLDRVKIDRVKIGPRDCGGE